MDNQKMHALLDAALQLDVERQQEDREPKKGLETQACELIALLEKFTPLL